LSLPRRHSIPPAAAPSPLTPAMAPPPQLELALGRIASSVSMDRGRPLPCPFCFYRSSLRRRVPFACERADPPLLHCLLLRILLAVADTGIRWYFLHLQARSNTPVSSPLPFFLDLTARSLLLLFLSQVLIIAFCWFCAPRST